MSFSLPSKLESQLERHPNHRTRGLRSGPPKVARFETANPSAISPFASRKASE
jgi:hypothetical protein